MGKEKVVTIRRRRAFARKIYTKEHIYRVYLECDRPDILCLSAGDSGGWAHCSPKLTTLINFAADMLFSTATSGMGVFIVTKLEFELYSRIEKNTIKDQMLQWNGATSFEPYLESLNRCVEGALKVDIVRDFMRTVIIDDNKKRCPFMKLKF